MRLKPLDAASNLVSNIGSLSKRVGLNVLELSSDTRPDRMVVLGDGSPDDNIMAIVCYHMNGRDIAWIIKPEKTGLNSLELVSFYTQRFTHKIKTYLFLIDQEKLSIDEFFKKAEKIFRDHGLELATTERREKRVAFYDCKLGPTSFRLILVINGRDDIQSTRHSVEDHLIAAGGFDVKEDSKDSWDKISKKEQDGVYQTLKTSPEVAWRTLPQHFLAIELLHKNM